METANEYRHGSNLQTQIPLVDRLLFSWSPPPGVVGVHPEEGRPATSTKANGEMGSGRLIGPHAERLTYEHLETMIRDDYVNLN
jgi:hypothetical protein